jgi:hypothetical protein
MAGILIPPAFGVTGNPSQKGTGPSLSIQHRLLQRSTTEPLSYFVYLQETDLSTVLLHDHMTAGVWIATQAADDTTAKINLAGADPAGATSQLDPVLPNGGQILVEHRSKNNALLQLRADFQGQSSLSVSFGVHRNLALFATSLMNGNAWAGGHFDKTFPLPQTLRRAESPAPSSTTTTTTITTTTMGKEVVAEQQTNTVPYEGLDIMCRKMVNLKMGAWIPVAAGDRNNRPDVIQGYVAANLLGATLASSLTCNGTSCDIKTYLSANLNDTDRPPLQVTLERDNKKAMIGLTQVLAFDRVQMNLFEERAPFVRNTLAWTVRLESTKAAKEGTEERTNRVLLGAAWQLNRSFAVKAVYNGSDVTTALLFKRWQHPRILCSVLNKWSPHGAPSFLGLGIELETGGVDEHPQAYYYAHHPEQPVVVDQDVFPQTRAVLPDDVARRL